MAGQSISAGSADQMVTKYSEFMSNLGVNMEEQTQSVSFSIAPLMNWLNSISNHSDELRICMAAYPDGDANEGRTTVVLWPYRNGQPAADGANEPIDPYNEGGGNP
jgi:hypothetical protein